MSKRRSRSQENLHGNVMIALQRLGGAGSVSAIARRAHASLSDTADALRRLQHGDVVFRPSKMIWRLHREYYA